jgi:Xaa-Pro aminopeptidase
MTSPTNRARSSALLAGVVLLAMHVAAPRVEAQRAERFTSWTHPVFPVAEYSARQAAAVAALGDNDVLLVPSAEGTSGGETFRQLDDFEYLAGLEVSRSLLAIDGRTHRSLLFVPRNDPRYENATRPNDFPGRPLANDPALRALSGVDTVLADDALEAFLSGIAARGARVLVDVGRPGTTIGAGPSSFLAPTPGDLLATNVQRVHTEITVTNGYALMATLRMVKSPREIAIMREAARVTGVAIARGGARVRRGADERTLTGAFTADCMALGAQRVAFTPIVKSGDNSLWPWRILGAQYDRRNRVMQDGELVIYDVGCERDHYVSDVGRTFPVAGHFTPRQRELVDMVKHISDAVIAAAKPGATLAALQRVASAAITGHAKPYMQAPLYFGHHIGLDAGDPSLADVALAPGMVFTIEPWYYNHDDRVAVFIEDEILITTTGAEILTAGLPRDATGLEQMRQGRGGALTDDNAGRTVTRDGVLSFTLDRAAGAVRVYDLLNGTSVAVTPVCGDPTTGVLSPDDVSFVVRCGGASVPVYVNTASYAIAPPPRVPPSPAATPGPAARKTEVLVVGTIHGEHRTSTRYGTDVLRRLLQAMRPDFVLTEIAPNRFDAAAREFASTGAVTEARVARFPEYVDALFPLTRTMHFTIVPTAAWSRSMDVYRTAALKRIEADPARRAEWQAYQRADNRADSLVAVRGADNPYFINSAAYDSIQTEAHEPYNRLFNTELGPGGWDNINVSHFANIARALDAHRGEGKRFVITYGAGHKEWFLRALRQRDDITLLEVAPFLEQIGAKR